MALSEAVGNAGRNFAPPGFADFFFDRLAAQAVGLQIARVVRTDRRELNVPRLTADAGAKWANEGDDLTTTDPASDTVTATPRKLAALVTVSNEVRDDSEPAILQMLGESIARSIALTLDRGIFEGSGTAPEIRGLKNTSGIGSVSMGANGATPTNLDPFAQALELLDTANAGPRRFMVMHPRTWGTLARIKETTGSAKPVLVSEAGPTGAITRSLYDIPVLLTSQLSITETQGTATNSSSAYVVDADQLVLVIRNDLQIETDASVSFRTDQSVVRGIARADFVVANPAGVVRIVGLLP